MTHELFSPLVEQALRVAATCHRHHHRKASNLPYITHPAAVALILIKAGFDDDEMLAASLLHDVVEDTDYTIDQLKDEFPSKVAEYVDALTEEKFDANGRKRGWRERKQDHLEEVSRATLEARAIVLADKFHNMSTMLYDLEAGEELWSRFGASPDKVLWYHRSMIERAAGDDERLQQLANACHNLIAQLKAILESG